MESQFQMTQNGLAAVQSDFNQLGQAALMDDRVLAEFLRLLPYDGVTVDRSILPYAIGGVVISNGASGSVLLNPFRAIVGSRVAAATSGIQNWREIRSAVWVGSATSLTASQSFTANASGNARWDLVYATITPDANTSTVARKKKSTADGSISTVNVVTTLVTNVTISVAVGTPSGSPAYPATPADGGGAYKIPLAYVRIPNGFGAGSTVLPTDIVGVAPIAKIRVGSDPGARPAKNNNAMPIVRAATWGNTGTRPPHFLPSDLSAGASRFVAMDIPDGTPANWSFASLSIIDDSLDWRKRYFNWMMAVGTSKLASDPSAAVTTVPRGTISTVGSTNLSGMGQSFVSDGQTAPMPGGGPVGSVVAYVETSQVPSVFGASAIAAVYVDASTGALMFYATGTVWPARIFLWIDATTQFANY